MKMGTLNSDAAWKRLGKEDPYYGVLSDEKYRVHNLTKTDYTDFFESGQKYVDEIFEEIRQLLQQDFNPGSVLDFGCGTGRLLIPLSRKATRATGVDISPDMLREAQKKCAEYGVENARFTLSDNDLSGLRDERFDLVNTYIVLQHMNVSRGEKIIRILLEKLNRGGVAAIHIVFARNASRFKKPVNFLRYRVPYLHNVLNLMQGRPFGDPMMQMNQYNMNKVLRMVYSSGVQKMKLKFTVHSGHLGAILIFQKAADTV